MKLFTSIFFFLFAVLSVSGQAVLDNNPPSLKWYEVKTPHFNVLFPKGFDVQAQRVANTLETIHAPESKTLGRKPKKVSVILQNQSSESNAFVSITPLRSEFYIMPSQDYNFVGNNDWLDMIASHEFRHVVQFQHAKQGFNKFVFYLFGQATLSAMANAAVPSWFWEGDAVATETAFLPTGRGSIPNFGLVFRTNFLEGRTFNYHKQYLRSYKHNIPNHYVLGYHMVSYLRKRTGDPDIWGRITGRAWRYSFVPFTFSNAIHKETGLYVKDLYKEMTKDLQQEWAALTDTLTLTAGNAINDRTTSAYTDYLYPHQLDDGRIVTVKSGIGDIEQLYVFDNLDEKKLFVMGMVNETGMIDVSGSRIAWNEYRYDPRWRVKNYSIIKVYDTKTKKSWKVSKFKSRYAGAGLSPNGEQVVTVETNTEYRHTLTILDVNTGNVVSEFSNPNNDFYSMPRFSDDGSRVVVLKKSKAGKSVVTVDVASGVEQEIISPSNENIGYPVLSSTHLFFNSPASGIDNIYAIDLKTTKRYRVTNSRYGSYNLSLSKDGKTIFYNEQKRNGMDIMRMPFDPTVWREEEEVKNAGKPLSEILVEQEQATEVLKNVPTNPYPVTKYNKAKGILNPYAWGPLYTNSLSNIDLGITSTDILSTTSISAGYLLDVYEGTGEWHADVSYQALYPIIRSGITYGSRMDNNKIQGSEANFKWKETGVYGGLEIPLLLTRSKYRTELSISNDVGVKLTSDFRSEVIRGNTTTRGDDRLVKINDSLSFLFNDITSYGKLIYNHFNINYSHALKQSIRDFYPRFGQYVSADSYTIPFGGDYNGWQAATRATLYFPGFAKHHSFYARLSYQKSLESPNLDTYTFRNRIAKPRGYSYPNNSTFYMVSGNYELPVWYPDIALGPILNFQRIRVNVFYDYGKGEGFTYFYDFTKDLLYRSNNEDIYKSYGGEVRVDLNLFRLLPQFQFGFRVSQITANRFNDAGLQYEFLIGNIPF